MKLVFEFLNLFFLVLYFAWSGMWQIYFVYAQWISYRVSQRMQRLYYHAPGSEFKELARTASVALFYLYFLCLLAYQLLDCICKISDLLTNK